MLVKISDLYKSFGTKHLFKGLSCILNEGEKVALIGRNGMGKTSLFKILVGEDKDYEGELEIKKDTKIILTKQEHYVAKDLSALDYILSNVPNYLELEQAIKDYEQFGEEKVSLEKYCDALQEFSELGYFEIRSKITQSLINFQLTEEKINGPLMTLSGGEKRFVELVRVMYSECDLALIDEPTNHMDYIGKEEFIKWLKSATQSLFIVTHDRDVLKEVDRILELKDGDINSYNGNYDAFTKQNSLNTVSSIQEYELNIKKIKELKAAIYDIEKSGTITKPLRIRRDKLARELSKLEEVTEKPSFWIDKESLNSISEKVTEKYHKYKEQNIKISANRNQSHKKFLLELKNLSLGYDYPLFDKMNFELYFGDKVFLKGRNGAGKSTLVKKIISTIYNHNIELGHIVSKIDDFAVSKQYTGDIKLANHLRLGVYEQELAPKYLEQTLRDAITDLYYELHKPINNQKINEILKRYLFDPEMDGLLKMKMLSGGQKARFQLIKMFVNEPNLLILDEPTNHLDLPSIEELEKALLNYHGGIIYISHDSYFIESIGGKVVEVGKSE